MNAQTILVALGLSGTCWLLLYLLVTTIREFFP